MVVNIGGITNFTFLIGKTKLRPPTLVLEILMTSLSSEFKKNFDDKGVAKNGKLSEEFKKMEKTFLNFPFPVSFDNFFKLDRFLKNKLK